MSQHAQQVEDRRVLVVDDDELTRYVVARRLRQWGYDPVAFEYPRDALQFLRDSSARALVSDMYMPETTGLSLARAVRLLRPEMPIVLMTGAPDPGLPERARADGVHEVVIKKTGSHSELLAALERAVVGRGTLAFDALGADVAGPDVAGCDPVASDAADVDSADPEMAGSEPHRADALLQADDSAVLRNAEASTTEDVELAHSLRTPLTALKSAIDILSESELPDAQRRFTGIAQRNVDQMIVLVERLLARSAARP